MKENNPVNILETNNVKVLLDASIDAAFLFNQERELVALNREGLIRLRKRNPSFKNKPAAFFIGKNINSLFPEEMIKEFSKQRMSIIKTKKTKRFQIKLENRILEIIGCPIDNPHYSIAVFSRDITKELETNNQIKRSEEKYNELINVLYEGYVITDTEGNIIFINEAIEKIAGYNKSDLIGRNIMQVFPKSELHKIEYNFNRLKNLEKVRFQTNYLTLKNGLRNLLFAASPTMNGKGEFDGIQTTITDITALNNIKQKLEYRIEFEKRIIEISSSFINLQESEIDRGIFNAIDTIGHFNNEKRIFLYVNSGDGSVYTKSHDWNMNRNRFSYTLPDEIDITKFHNFGAMLKKHQIIHVPDISRLDQEVKKEIISPEKTGIRSFLIVPMILKNKLIGFMGTGSPVLKTWSEDEISMIKMALGVISLVIERKTINSVLTDVISQRLSEREMEFVTYLSQGHRWPKDKRIICKKMDVLPGTLDKFMQRIKEKVNESELELIIKSLKKQKEII